METNVRSTETEKMKYDREITDLKLTNDAKDKRIEKLEA